MEANNLVTIRDQIVIATAKYLSKLDQWSTIDIIQSTTELLVEKLCSITNIELNAPLAHHEPQSDSKEANESDPQSDSEEAKESNRVLDFERAILTEARQFILAVEDWSVAKDADLDRLKTQLDQQKDNFEQLDNLKETCGGSYQSLIT